MPLTSTAIAIVMACTPNWCQPFQAAPPMQAVQCIALSQQIAAMFTQQRPNLKIKSISCMTPEKAYETLMTKET